MNRRSFLGLFGLAAGLPALPLLAAPTPRRRIPDYKSTGVDLARDESVTVIHVEGNAFSTEQVREIIGTLNEAMNDTSRIK